MGASNGGKALKCTSGLNSDGPPGYLEKVATAIDNKYDYARDHHFSYLNFTAKQN